MTEHEQDGISLAHLHPEDGRAIRYHVDDFMIEWIASMAADLTREVDVRGCARHLDDDLLLLYLEQALYMELIHTGRDFHRRLWVKRQGGAPAPVACPPSLLELVRRHWPETGIEVRAGDAVFFRRPLAPLRAWVRERAWRVVHPRTSLPSQSGATVAVELVEGADPSAKSDAFWLRYSQFDPSRTLFVFERGNRVFFDTAAQLAAVRQIGAHAVALHPDVSLGGRIPLWYPRSVPAWAARAKRELDRGRTPLTRWLTAALGHCLDRVSYWEAFALEHNVAVFQQFTEVSLETPLRRLAMQRTGGIEVGKQRSQFFERSSAAFHFQHDVAFLWSDSAQASIAHGRTRTLGFVVTGYVYDNLFALAKEDAAELRNRLAQAGASRVVSLYDNAAHVNGHFSADHMLEFYSVIVEQVEQHADFGLIIKAKKTDLLARHPTIAKRLEGLRAAGRCIVLDRGAASSVAPSALACDIAVGIPTSTAACEAALGGCRVLMYDPGGARDHPWVPPHRHHIVHRDLQSFMRALQRFFAAPGSDETGDVSNGLAQIDPFRDGCSAQRAGAFIAAAVKMKDAGQRVRDQLRDLPHYQPSVDAPRPASRAHALVD